MEEHVQNEIAQLGTALARRGLDVLQWFDASEYNRAVEAHEQLSPLDLLGRPTSRGALAALVGNTRALWRPFIDALNGSPALRADSDPLDRFVESVLRDALASCALPHRLYLGHDGGARLVSMLHAAEVSRLAHRGPAHLAVHPTHGPWFGLRAVLVFDAAPPAIAPAPAPAPCNDCDAPCTRAFDAAIGRSDRIPRGEAGALDASAIRPAWRAWVAVRDACPVGSQARYGPRQLRYHYTRDRRALAQEDLP